MIKWGGGMGGDGVLRHFRDKSLAQADFQEIVDRAEIVLKLVEKNNKNTQIQNHTLRL